MEGKVGENHPAQTRLDTAEAKAERIAAFLRSDPIDRREDSAARRSRWCSVRRSRRDQSNPKILTVAVGLSPRISYWTFTDVRRPLRPGASVAAVCPPAFRVPTLVSVASLRVCQPRTTLVIFTSAPSTESFTCLTSFCHRPPSVLISALGSVELIVSLSIT